MIDVINEVLRNGIVQHKSGMFDFYQKRKLRSLINSRYVQGILLCLVLLVGWSAYTRYEIAAEMTERRKIAEQEAQVQQDRKDELQKQVEYLSNERGIEAEMRRQFDVALEGEKVVVIMEAEETVEVMPLDGASTTEQSTAPWYQFWR